ncbi:MAG: hypothetical protein ACFE0O_13795 [Opitutales bacterium]
MIPLRANRTPGPIKASRTGFTLIEVVLAIGIFTLAILTLLGLLAPTLQSVNDVINTSLAKGVISKVNTTLQTYDADGVPETGANHQSPFEEVFNAVRGAQQSNQELAFYAYQLKNGQVEVVDDASAVTAALAQAASGDTEDTFDGPLFMILISASSVNDETLRTGALPSAFIRDRSFYGIATDYDSWPEAYLALKIEIVTLQTPPPGSTFDPPGPDEATRLTDDAILFSYNTAVTR